MKKISVICLIASIILTIWYVGRGIIVRYRYERDIYSHWELADKSSTIEKKCEHIDVFVSKLENSGLSGKYNAVWQETPDNSFDNNLDALKTLQSRLHEIKGLNPESFEYQTAIQQITSQEQGEAGDMLKVFKGVWKKEYYPLYWSWYSVLFVLLLILSIVMSFAMVAVAYEWG